MQEQTVVAAIQNLALMYSQNIINSQHPYFPNVEEKTTMAERGIQFYNDRKGSMLFTLLIHRQARDFCSLFV